MTRIVVTIAALVVSATIGVQSKAYPIQYSWAGTIVPNGTDDPWFVGQQGQPFSLSAVASDSAIDLLDDSVQFSTFNLIDADLVVDGQHLSYVANGFIDFTDNSGGVIDVILMGGDFQRFGTTIGIETAVVLNPSTFSFTQQNESLPVFPSISNVDHVTCCGGTYTFIVEAGTAVSVIPEPTSALLCLIASILLVTTRRNNWLLYFRRPPLCTN